MPGEGEVLYTMNWAGNVHSTVHDLNERLPQLVPYVLSIEFTGGNYSLVLMRGPAAVFEQLRAEKKIW